MQFDYIVVGAGSAGCVVANRLSANPANRVLLLEAGPKDRNPMIHMPGGCTEVLKSKTLNWQLWSTPQKQLADRRIWIPRGRTLGGSSASNGMVYIRGHASDYDDWAAAGNAGWAYRDVLPLFRKFENQARGADEFHGVDGELYVGEPTSDNILFDRFIAAGEELGVKHNRDFNGAEQEGFGRFQVTIKNGRRQSSAVAFLRPVLQRPNLTIVTGATVSRVLLTGDRATGIEYVQGRTIKTAIAGKEIVLSAGAVKNPQILQLSGIGHRDDLARAGVALKHELPGVGRNLQEHLDVLLRYEATQPITMNGLMRADKQLKIALQYLFTKTGVAATNGIEAGAFIRSTPEQARPDLQMHFVPANMIDLIQPLPKQHGITLHVCNLRPKSRGTATIASSNPLDAPVIDFNFLAEEDDWQTMLRAYKWGQNLMAAKAWNGLIGKPISPDAIAHKEEDMRRAIPHCAESVYHPVGSCKMGIDSESVVDPQLRVHGLKGLRIADVSIMPAMIGGNTNAPAMMIGERCAGLMLA